MSLSCVIPLGPQDEWNERTNQKFLAVKNIFDEVLIVGSDLTFSKRLPANFRRVPAKRSQLAHQLNLGAHEAKGTYVSFLHFDSDFDSGIFEKLRLILKEQVLYYFELDFAHPAPMMCEVNAWAANLRADVAHIPFGEQCFTMSKKNFLDVGAFNESIGAGEDAEFVRRWKAKGYRLQKAKGTICTSPRKYQQNGWLKTTRHAVAWNLKFLAGKEPKELVS